MPNTAQELALNITGDSTGGQQSVAQLRSALRDARQDVKDLTKAIPFYGQRHIVRPGLTGWAQVRYSYGASVEDSMQKLQYDLFYIKHMSVALDAYIVFRTIKNVLQGRGV